MAPYGEDDDDLRDYIQNLPAAALSVELVEVFRAPDKKSRVSQRQFSMLDPLTEHLTKQIPETLSLRVLVVTKLSGPLLQFLGAKYQMDYELWTCRFKTSDREWFAGPLLQGGARFFSHFNLSAVDFMRVTAETPAAYTDARKIGHTVRLVRLLDATTRGKGLDPRVFVIRRVSGHLRLDGRLWTFLYFPDPYHNMDDANFVSQIPANAQPQLAAWIDNYVGDGSPEALIDDLSNDGFGFVLKVLREIKTSWKLFLNEMEGFLEDLTEDFDDEALIESANWLHRKFILMVDYSERQLNYHSRFITYLTNAPSQHGLCIRPTTFERDLLQERDAMVVVCSRFLALRTRTSAILDTAMNLHAVRQARISQNMMELQRRDAELAFNQNQSIKRLTVLNMVYLPATFIAGVYGMNVADNGDHGAWSLWSFGLVASLLTILTLALAMFRIEIAAVYSVKSYLQRHGSSSSSATRTTGGKPPWFQLVDWIQKERERRKGRRNSVV